jgi:hypothetical protein
MNKKVLIALLLTCFLVLLGFIAIKNEYVGTHPSLKFSRGQCDIDIDPYSEPKAGILSQEWRNSDTLIVEGYVKTYCGGADIYGDHTIGGKNIILKYKIEPGDVLTPCLCSHKIIYEISNLRKKDYSVSLTSQ